MCVHFSRLFISFWIIAATFSSQEALPGRTYQDLDNPSLSVSWNRSGWGSEVTSFWISQFTSTEPVPLARGAQGLRPGTWTSLAVQRRAHYCWSAHCRLAEHPW